jgi:hypothetical protein
MMTLHDFFGLVCHQDASRSYVIAGEVLPLCQRCTGLYLGVAVGMVSQWLSGSYRKGLPGRAAFTAVLCSLLIMPVFGFHLLDPGPGWRLWSGLIYGHAIAWLLVPATFSIGRGGGLAEGLAREQAWIFWCPFVFLNTVPLWFPLHWPVFAWSVLGLVCCAVLGLVGCLTACLVFFVRSVLDHVRVKGDLHGPMQS